MKKLLYAFLLVGVLVACHDDDDDKKVFAKTDLYGTWKSTEKDKDSGCYSLVDITEAEFSFGDVCDGDSDYDSGFKYTYENNTITLTDAPVSDYKLVVTDLNSTTLKLDYHLGGVKMNSETFAKVK